MSVRLGKNEVQSYLNISNGQSKPVLKEITVSSSMYDNTIVPPSGVDGYNKITVTGDTNLISENIKKDVTILGVTGTLNPGISPVGKINLTNTNVFDVTNYAEAQVVDNNLIPSNIKKDVTILGIKGTLESGGSGSNELLKKMISVEELYLTKEDLQGLTRIGPYAFFWSHLVSIEIPDGVTVISDGAFSQCSYLTSVIIPVTVNTLYGQIFASSPKLTEITYKGTKEQWNSMPKVSNWNSKSNIKTIACTDGVININ